MHRSIRPALLVVVLAALGGCARSPNPTSAGAVDDARLRNAAAEPDQWFTTGRDGGGSYHSPLKDIDANNVARLGFAWEYRLPSHRGMEATPVVVDGTLYVASTFGRVDALDAVTGQARWTYDPGIDGQYGRYACCDAVNRGVAVRQGVVYVGALDGYLHAIDAATGRRIYKVDTLPARGREHPYTITGAPVVAGDAIVIGAAGGDFDGIRGYVGAWDAKTGAPRWRFYTVPRDPAQGPQDQPHLVAATATWDPHHDWTSGGGGTVWDGINYDPDLDLVYIGTGNGSPYDLKKDGRTGGDGLYAASIVAIHAKDGTLAWHYQVVPGDEWDFDATQKMVLTDLDLGTGPRKVLMQASKNGFLYVLDRATGAVLAVHNYVYVNWTRGIDPNTHRPIPNPTAEYVHTPRLIAPGMGGGHNWQPMAWNPSSKLVYIPALEAPMVYIESNHKGLLDGAFDVFGVYPEDYDPKSLEKWVGVLPSLAALRTGNGAPVKTFGVLRAVDPLTGKIVWEQPNATPWDGGVMTTAGNLVFQGDATGHLNVYAADDGHPLAKLDLGTGIMAAPATYKIGNTQYVTVLAGYGGANGIGGPFAPATAAAHADNTGRLITLKLDGGAVPKPAPVVLQPFPQPLESHAEAATIAHGGDLYLRECARCHAMGYGMLPDLRRLTPEKHAMFADIVLKGALKGRGMGQFDDRLSADDVTALHAFLIDEAWKAFRAQGTGKAP